MDKEYTLEEYMKMPHRIEIIPDTLEGGFAASYPELPGCITCADTMAELEEMLTDCKREWLKAAIKTGVDIYVPTEYEEMLAIRNEYDIKNLNPKKNSYIK